MKPCEKCSLSCGPGTASKRSLFGSFTRPAEHPAADLDVLVSFSEPPSLVQFLELENLLSDRLGFRVDLVMRDALKPRIGARILQSLVPL